MKIILIYKGLFSYSYSDQAMSMTSVCPPVIGGLWWQRTTELEIST